MYRCESWTINKSMQNKIDATEMWFLRRMLKISYLDRITNKEVLQRAKASRALMKNIRKQQSKFIGHTMRQRSLEHLVTTGKMEVKRSRGRQREKMLDSLSTWLQKDTPGEVLSCTCDRIGWRSMIAEAGRHGT